MPIRSDLALLLIASLLATGCAKKVAPDPTPALPVASVGPPVTEAEAREFGVRLIGSLKEKDRGKFDGLMRMDDFCRRCVQDLGLSAQNRDSLLQGMLAGQQRLFDDFCAICEGADLAIAGVRTHGNRAQVILRRFGADGMNYLICTPARFPGGAVALEDILMASTGEPMSLTLRRTTMTLMPPATRGTLKLGGTDRAMLDNLTAIRSITQAIRDKDFANARRKLKALPAELRDEKQYALMAVVAGQGLGDESYAEEIERYMRLFPGDPSLDLMTIDYWLAKDDWKRGLECIDRLDRFVGGDPYLDLFRALFLVKAGRGADAIAAARKLVAVEPKLMHGYTTLAFCQAKAGDFPGAADTFRRVVTEGGTVELGEVMESPDYAEFIESPEFAELKKWLAERAK